MAVRWRTRRTAPAPADDGRWGVARLAAQRQAERHAREVLGAQPPPEATAASPQDTAPSPEATAPSPEDTAPPAEDSVPGPRTPETPAPPPPRRAPAGPVRTLPSPRRPRTAGQGVEGPVYRPPAVSARPRVEPEPGLIGFSRLTRGRTGARVFTLVFVGIYLVILVQTLSTIV
ncbi:hypothetical protein [Pseudonocardia parietis]|uniref:Uncharacterized protein n=1 Tax=Pseudonocardia parietis TaxID=570936 RepID=A0ABS4VMB2_9PSEU|nr:hypothetical protein [Pseudonocardia parietis]MBP2365035.1 hypothetical protein [Pseudonocardia parietis]